MKHKPGLFERILLALKLSRFDIVKMVDGKEEMYLRRFHLIKRNKFLLKLTKGKYEGLYLHHILRPDEDRHLHDHPWDFSVFVLAGGYEEDIPHPKYGSSWRHGLGLLSRIWHPLSFRSSSAKQLHKISADNFKTTWTLIFVGPKRRKWGFKTEKGWMPYDEYLPLYCPEQVPSTDPARIDPDSEE